MAFAILVLSDKRRCVTAVRLALCSIPDRVTVTVRTSTAEPFPVRGGYGLILYALSGRPAEDERIVAQLVDRQAEAMIVLVAAADSPPPDETLRRHAWALVHDPPDPVTLASLVSTALRRQERLDLVRRAVRRGGRVRQPLCAVPA